MVYIDKVIELPLSNPVLAFCKKHQLLFEINNYYRKDDYVLLYAEYDSHGLSYLDDVFDIFDIIHKVRDAIDKSLLEHYNLISNYYVVIDFKKEIVQSWGSNEVTHKLKLV